MSDAQFIRVGKTILNVNQIGSCHWEESNRLFVHTSGNRWREFGGREARLLWTYLESRVVCDVVAAVESASA